MPSPAPAAANPAEFVARVQAERRQRWTGMRIACEVGLSPETVSRILRGSNLSRIEPGLQVLLRASALGDMAYFKIST